MTGVSLPKIKVIGDNSLKNRIEGALHHVYPSLQVIVQKDVKKVDKEVDIIILDTKCLKFDKALGVIKLLEGMPIIVLVSDVIEFKKIKDATFSRREVVLKSEFNGTYILHIVEHLIEKQKLHEQLKKASYRIKDISIHDDLTNLFNYKHFHELLNQEVKKTGRYNRPLSLIVIDLKNFSIVNEQFGNYEGDRLIVKATNQIKSTTREVDLMARYGDTTFAIILPETDMNAAVVAAKRLEKSLNFIYEVNKDLGLAIGVASLGDGAKDKEELLKTAFLALAFSKKNGLLCTTKELERRKNELKENKIFITQINSRLIDLEKQAKQNAFTAFLNTINNESYHRRYVLPHSERVAFIAKRIASSVDISEDFASTVYRASILHDIGKLAIDSEVLNKASKLSSDELDLIKQHSLFGFQMLENVSFLSKEANLILNHHECYNGNGYPEGFSDKEIPIGSRIIFLAEAWDSMVTSQPYREVPLELDNAIKELEKGAGSQFDPEIVEMFISLIKN